MKPSRPPCAKRSFELSVPPGRLGVTFGEVSVEEFKRARAEYAALRRGATSRRARERIVCAAPSRCRVEALVPFDAGIGGAGGGAGGGAAHPLADALPDPASDPSGELLATSPTFLVAVRACAASCVQALCCELRGMHLLRAPAAPGACIRGLRRRLC